MRNSLNIHAAVRPREGDVLIAAATDSPSAWTLSVVPAPQQIRYQTFDEALATGRKFAWSQGVSLWFTNDGTIFTALRVDQ